MQYAWPAPAVIEDGECKHGGDPATCPVCRRAAGKDKSLAAEGVTYSGSFSAKFPGYCKSCESGISKGSQIKFREEGGDKYVIHEGCF